MKKYIGSKIVTAWPVYRISRGVGKYEYAEVGDIIQGGGRVEEGYRVRYEDGYVSWSPKAVFEAAYRETTGLSFGLAIEALKLGLSVARKGWNGKGIYLELQMPDEHSKMTLPYIYIVTNGLITDNPHAPKGRVPWLASQTDMLADDWYIVE